MMITASGTSENIAAEPCCNASSKPSDEAYFPPTTPHRLGYSSMRGEETTDYDEEW